MKIQICQLEVNYPGCHFTGVNPSIDNASILNLCVTSLFAFQSMVLLMQSQRQYIFEFDGSGRVTAVTMPSVARHTMFTHVSVGYIRNTYNPPESNASIIHDFSEDGRPQAIHCLGTGRRVLYKYGKLAKLSEIVYDSTAVTFGYDETAGVLKMVNLQSGGFSCTIRYRKMGPLIDKQIYRFSEEGMVNARFDYTYHDNSFRIASMKPVISETPLPVDLYRYDEISGKVHKFCSSVICSTVFVCQCDFISLTALSIFPSSRWNTLGNLE